MKIETVNSGNDVPIDVPDILADAEINQAVKHGLKYLMGTEDADGNHWMFVCMVCDQFVYAIGKVKLLLKELSLKNKLRLFVRNLRHFLGERFLLLWSVSISWRMRNCTNYCCCLDWHAEIADTKLVSLATNLQRESQIRRGKLHPWNQLRMEISLVRFQLMSSYHIIWQRY